MSALEALLVPAVTISIDEVVTAATRARFEPPHFRVTSPLFASGSEALQGRTHVVSLDLLRNAIVSFLATCIRIAT